MGFFDTIYDFFNVAAAASRGSAEVSAGAVVGAGMTSAAVADYLMGINPSLVDAIYNRFRGADADEDAQADDSVGQYLDNQVAENEVASYYGVEIDQVRGFLNAVRGEQTDCGQALADKVKQKADNYENSLAVEIPEQYLCPITLCIMREPVVIVTEVNGQQVRHHFDREAVDNQINIGYDPTDPLNRQPIKSVENDEDLQKQISDFLGNPDNYEQATRSNTLS